MSFDANEPVAVTMTGAVADVEIRRAREHNAIDIETAQALLQCCRALRDGDSARAVVLSGAGMSFGVGGDLNELASDSTNVARKLIGILHEAVSLLLAIDAPVIAKLRGRVAGGSMSLSLACDLAVASSDTKFNFAYANAGTTADVGGSWHLPYIVGLRNAMEIALLSETIDADRARALGIVNQVVPDGQLDAAVDALAHRLAQGPTRAFGRMKRLLRGALSSPLDTQLAAEMGCFVESTRTADFAEALAAFLSKRAPRFAGR